MAWCHGSDDWSVGMDGCRLIRKTRQGRQGLGVTLYVSDQLECMELCLGMDEELTKSLYGSDLQEGQELVTLQWGSDKRLSN